ncbi:MAG: chitobiase/beta-hexosaminidase C-terminal domain-containing protein [Candidatus Nomurabacteria bacterium]|nr:chitobiase/beta-hexosaminidase C-terminal domain-containing protein [Candidatus Nomurabacteria bacterium]
MATPSAGLYNATQSVTLSASGSDSIRYSTSGIPADCSSGTLYSTSISVSTTSTIYVRACDLAGNSSTTSFAYTIDTVPPSTPVATPTAGLFNSTQSVSLSALGSDLIRYALDSAVADCSSGTLYSTNISISISHTINVRACDLAGNSSTASFTYTIDTVPPSTPVASPGAGLFNSTQSVSLSAIGSDSIRYSTSSTPADCSSGTLYSTNISVSSSQTIYVRACDLAGNSSTASFAYTIDTIAPSSATALPDSGLFNSTQSVTLSASGSDSIRYSTSSTPSDCSSGTLYSTSISVSTTQTIYVRACDLAGNSSTTSFTYTIDTTPPSTPTVSIPAGLYNSTQSITLSASGSDSIRYSTSGIPASCVSDNLYSTAISVSTTQTIYVRACDLAGNSSTASFVYTIDTVPPSIPVSNPVAGLYNSTQSVSLSATGSDSIRYSTSGTPANCSSGTLYTGAISVSTSQTIYTLACESGSDSIRYSTSGAPADCSSGTLYSTNISVSSSQTIYVRACDLAGNSSTTSFTYTIDTTPPSTPVVSPVAGLYNSTQSVILSATGSDLIKYSISNTPTDCSSGTLYTGAISVSISETVYVRACDTAGNSSTASFVYVIDTTPPEIPIANPVAGSYPTERSVLITAVGSDSIRYSTTGIPTDCSSGNLYSNAITVSTTGTIYVRACDILNNSSTATFAYIIDPSLFVSPPVIPVVSSGHPNFAPVMHVAASVVSSFTENINNKKEIKVSLVNNSLPFNNPTNTELAHFSNLVVVSIRKINITLETGVVGDSVKTLQEFLISQAKGPKAKELRSNGATSSFGNLTKAALKEWQGKNGLPATGIFGPQTRAKIKKLVK